MKSEKAEAILSHVCNHAEFFEAEESVVPYLDAVSAVEQAEAERDAKAVEVHRGCCPELRSDNECHAKFDGLDIYSPYLPKCNSKCTYMNDFIQKLNEE